MVALVWLLPCMRPHVNLQLTTRNWIVVALITLQVRLLSLVVPHNVLFQFTSCYAEKLARCASVRILTIVDHFVLLQMTWSSWRIVTLCGFWPDSGVSHFVPLQISWIIWRLHWCGFSPVCFVTCVRKPGLWNIRSVMTSAICPRCDWASVSSNDQLG